LDLKVLKKDPDGSGSWPNGRGWSKSVLRSDGTAVLHDSRYRYRYSAKDIPDVGGMVYTLREWTRLSFFKVLFLILKIGFWLELALVLNTEYTIWENEKSWGTVVDADDLMHEMTSTTQKNLWIWEIRQLFERNNTIILAWSCALNITF
jgi:arginyl-tRNA synthetase